MSAFAVEVIESNAVEEEEEDPNNAISIKMLTKHSSNQLTGGLCLLNQEILMSNYGTPLYKYRKQNERI